MTDEAGREGEGAVAGGHAASAAEAHAPDVAASATASTASGDATQAETEARRLRLRRLKIHEWRNVLPGSELIFADEIHALLGKNGSGKTSLLRLISMCLRSNFAEAASETFHVEYDLEWGDHRLSVDLANQPGELAEADVLLAARRLPAHGRMTRSGFRFRTALMSPGVDLLTAEGTPTSLLLNGHPLARESATNPFEYRFLAALAAQILGLGAGEETTTERWYDLVSWGSPLLHIWDRSWSAGIHRFDEANGLLDAMDGTVTTRGECPALRWRILLSPKPGLSGTWIARGIREAVLLPDIRSSLAPTEIRLTHDDLSPLLRFSDLAGFSSAAMILSLQGKEQQRDDSEAYLFGNCKFLITLKNGNIITHDKLSFGQRRLLAFLYYAACNPDVLIADELTNGLHHEWIAACADELMKRQSFVATQNPLLLDYLPIETVQDAETAFIQCRLVEKDGKEWMHWRNTSPEEASRFWESYESGVQYISEILRTEGLW